MNRWRTFKAESDQSIELDSLETSALQNVCEMDGRAGLPVCNSLNLALSLLLPFMQKIAVSDDVTALPFEVRSTVACPVCKRQQPLSISFGSYAGILSWLRSLEVVAEGDTSIIWLTEVRKHGRESRDAFGIWPDVRTSVVTVGGRLLGSGKSS